MPRKLTYDNVKNYILEKSNGTVELISNEYVNSSTLLKLRCSCGNVFFKTFDKIRSRNCYCNECSRKRASALQRVAIEDVMDIIAQGGCEYLSGEYINYDSKLKLKCPCGNVFYKSFKKYKDGQNRCPDCGKKKIADRRRYTFAQARNDLAEYGYTLLEEECLGASVKMRCLCKNGHECDIILSQLKVGRSGCKRCARDAITGPRSVHYNGGVAKIQDVIRMSLDPWRRAVRKLYDDTCPITGAFGKEVDVHHIIGIREIYNYVSNQFGENVPLNGLIKDFSSYDVFDAIRLKIMDLHVVDMGIVISKDIHREFHKKYGHNNVGVEELYEYLKTKYAISLWDILKERNSYVM